MARLRLPLVQVERTLGDCLRAGQELTESLKLAERTAGYGDWLDLFQTWRVKTLDTIRAAYEDHADLRTFDFSTLVTARSIEQLTFEDTKGRLTVGLLLLENLIAKLPLALPEPQEFAGMRSLHPEIYARCPKLFETGDYAEAVEKGFKVVRDRLRTLSTHETGSEAFGKGRLEIEGAAAPHVDKDFQEGVKFLTMAIDKFRNEKAHTADGNINDPVRAYEYLRLSSLAMHLLDRGLVR